MFVVNCFAMLNVFHIPWYVFVNIHMEKVREHLDKF